MLANAERILDVQREIAEAARQLHSKNSETRLVASDLNLYYNLGGMINRSNAISVNLHSLGEESQNLHQAIERSLRHIRELVDLIKHQQERVQEISNQHLCDLMVESHSKRLLISSDEEDYCRPPFFHNVRQIERTVTMKETSTVTVSKKDKGYFSSSSSSSFLKLSH